MSVAHRMWPYVDGPVRFSLVLALPFLVLAGLLSIAGSSGGTKLSLYLGGLLVGNSVLYLVGWAIILSLKAIFGEA